MFNIFVFYSEYKYCYAVKNLAFVGLKEIFEKHKFTGVSYKKENEIFKL